MRSASCWLILAVALGGGVSAAAPRNRAATKPATQPAIRAATGPTTGPAHVDALRARLDLARAGVAKARADVIRRLEDSPQYKAAVADLQAREKALAKAKASQQGIEWAELMLRSARKRIARLREDALTASDKQAALALKAAADARTAYVKAGGQDLGIFHEARDARRIVIVCDASRDMINVFAHLRGELTRWISSLKQGQEFNIVLFGKPRVSALSSRGLLPANPDNQRKAYKFLEDEVSTGGERDPAAALEIAFRNMPEVVYLLTSGDFTDNEAVLAQVRKLNADRKIRVHTASIVTVYGYTPTMLLDLLYTISTESGGTFDNVDLEAGLEHGTVR
jgi:hypothetical protein